MKLNLRVLKEDYAIVRFNADDPLPPQPDDADFYSLTRSRDEVTIVTAGHHIPKNVRQINKNWRVLYIEEILDFELVGIIAEISTILKENNISLFTVSTYDTDYILVKQKDLNSAVESIRQAGHHVSYEK